MIACIVWAAHSREFTASYLRHRHHTVLRTMTLPMLMARWKIALVARDAMFHRGLPRVPVFKERETEMSHITAAEMHDLTISLQLRRQELVAQLRQRLHAEAQQEMALFNNYTIEADQAAASQLSDTDIGLLNREMAELRTVDAALARLQAHCYGRCSRCGATIPTERLLALPEAHMCLECQSACETSPGQPQHSHRPGNRL
jgi:DnaK suppressor protein